MNNEPKASMSIDPELLAAYIDRRLSPGQRTAVEAQLAEDPDSYALLIETMKAQDALGSAAGVNATPAKRSWLVAASAIAAAAVIALAVWTSPSMLQRQRVDPRIERLAAAVGERRYIEGRLAADFKAGPLRTATRGANDTSQDNLELRAAAADLQHRAASDPSAENLHAYGAAALLLGSDDEAIAALERSLQKRRHSGVLNDLAAAYAARAGHRGDRADWETAHRYATEALADPGEARVQALFNKALAATNLRLESAPDAWRQYLTAESDQGWQSVGRQYLESLPADLRR